MFNIEKSLFYLIDPLVISKLLEGKEIKTKDIELIRIDEGLWRYKDQKKGIGYNDYLITKKDDTYIFRASNLQFRLSKFEIERTYKKYINDLIGVMYNGGYIR